VAATTDRQAQSVLAGEAHGVDDVGDARGSDDDRRPSRIHRVERHGDGRVAGLLGREHFSSDRHPELIEGLVKAFCLSGRRRARGHNRPPFHGRPYC
jgi:hypothetical protein